MSILEISVGVVHPPTIYCIGLFWNKHFHLPVVKTTTHWVICLSSSFSSPWLATFWVFNISPISCPSSYIWTPPTPPSVSSPLHKFFNDSYHSLSDLSDILHTHISRSYVWCQALLLVSSHFTHFCWGGRRFFSMMSINVNPSNSDTGIILAIQYMAKGGVSRGIPFCQGIKYSQTKAFAMNNILVPCLFFSFRINLKYNCYIYHCCYFWHETSNLGIVHTTNNNILLSKV